MVEAADYCRQIEAYLCQKNGGHLIRIVGPAFETVREWAETGVPLKVAFRGIDRCCDRARARGGRRRPMRIEFCEADVLDAFDEWRRASGVTATASDDGSGSVEEARPQKGSLAAHVQRSVARLLAVRAPRTNRAFDELVAGVIGELDALVDSARKPRGEARERTLTRLAELDARLIEAACSSLPPGEAAALQKEADGELAPFAGRMSRDALLRARRVAFERLVRDALNLPVLRYE